MKEQKPPLRIIVPGRVYRRDTADATHNPTFHQVEGLYVDKGVTVSDLKGTVEFVFRELMGPKTQIRFRPHYFSYTEPSFEIDFANSLTRKMGKDWLRLPVAAWCIRLCWRRLGSIPRNGAVGRLARYRTHRHVALRHQRHPALLRK